MADVFSAEPKSISEIARADNPSEVQNRSHSPSRDPFFMPPCGGIIRGRRRDVRVDEWVTDAHFSLPLPVFVRQTATKGRAESALRPIPDAAISAFSNGRPQFKGNLFQRF